MTAPTVAPAVGQVWADNDPRSAGRTILVTEVIAGGRIVTPYVTVETLTNMHPTRYVTSVPDRRGTTTTIKAARLRPTSAGYRMLGTLGFGLDDVTATTPAGVQSAPFQDREDAARWLLGQEA